MPGKVDYPPPPAHSRTSKSSLPVGALHDKSSVVGPSHSSLPKAEPNVNLFSYSSTYTTQASYLHDIKVKSELGQPHKSLPGKSGLAGGLERDHHGREVLQNTSSLLPDHKSSVIVKNEGRELPKAPTPQQHSSSPKINLPYLNLQSVTPQHKPAAYEYRSPTQSPHHLHPAHLDGLQVAKIPPPASHHRGGSGSGGGSGVPTTTTQLPSPHGHPPPPPPAPASVPHSHNPRQSPHAPPQHPHQPPPPPHPSPPEPRYLSRPEPTGLPYGAAKSTYPYPHPHPPTTAPTTASHYAAPPPAGSKPKVSSPAPPHIYGKPNSGIMTGTPVCRASEPPVAAPIPLTSKAGSSPYQQVPHHHGAPPPPLPPPAHSSRSVYDSRGFAGSLPGAKLPPPPLHGSPPIAVSAPLSRPIAHPAHHTNPHQQPGQTLQHTPSSQITTAFQTQPLDLGVERSGSPKRKASTPLMCDNSSSQPVSLEVCKKRRTEEQQPLSLQCVGSPVLSRVSEPSPLIASAATSITTVVNTAALLAQPNNQMIQEQRTIMAVSPAPRTASGDGSVRPASTGSVCSLNPAPVSAAPSPAPIPSPAPSTAPSPAPSAPGTPAKVNPSTADSEKSNSPAPRPPSSTSYPVHKLKKAWLQRHSRCEDGTENSTGMVVGGSCVTLPLNIARTLNETPSSQQGLNSKDRENDRATSNANNSGGTTATTTTTCLPSAVNSIHNIGSMAVNSINKSKVTGKSGRKPANKESLNGHATDTSKTPQEDSSSSDPERKSPPKRKPPKVSIFISRIHFFYFCFTSYR